MNFTHARGIYAMQMNEEQDGLIHAEISKFMLLFPGQYFVTLSFEISIFYSSFVCPLATLI